MIKRFSLDTSSFLPSRGKAADHFKNSWQRFVVECDEGTWQRFRERREQIEDECNRTGRWAKFRAFERAFVKRYSV